jgi:hypothetical protein
MYAWLTALVDFGVLTKVLVSSLLGTLIVALLSVFAIFRPVVNSVRRSLEAAVRPVNEIRDIANFAALLSESLSEWDGDYSRLVMFRALPCEVSLPFLRHCFGKREFDTAIRAIRVYQDCVTEIVREGRGAHDKSIFGRTGIEKLDGATEDTILQQYFSGNEATDTTDLGLHDNFNEMGIILLGETIEERRPDLKEWKAGFIIIFSEDFQTVRGFRHNVHGHIANLKVVFDQRQKDCEKKGMYFSLSSSMPERQVIALRETVRLFFQGSSAPEALVAANEFAEREMPSTADQAVH